MRPANKGVEQSEELLAAESALDHIDDLATEGETDTNGGRNTDDGETQGEETNRVIHETSDRISDRDSINCHGALYLLSLRICYDASPTKNGEDNVEQHKEGRARGNGLDEELQDEIIQEFK